MYVSQSGLISDQNEDHFLSVENPLVNSYRGQNQLPIFSVILTLENKRTLGYDQVKTI
jgi:hypothetical protein